MNRKTVTAVAAIILAGCQPPQIDYPGGINHVVVIGIDGMSPNGIAKADTPVLDRMMREGASTMHARAVLPSSSSSNWASMIMGADTEQHGITSNGWERDNHILPPVVTGTEELFPTVFSVLDQQRPEATVAVVYHWSGFGRLYEKSAVDFDRDTPTEEATAAEAARVIREHRPTLTFVHIDHVDGAGHGQGHGTEAYYDAVSKADSLIGVIVEAADEAGIGGSTLFIVSADHGGVGYGHGGETLAEMEIPFILYGAGVKPDHTISHTVFTYDNAATVAFAFGLEPPYAWIGRPVRSAFTGFDGPPNATALNVTVEAPVIMPRSTSYAPPGILSDGPQTVSISSGVADGVIRYTTDGSEPTAESPVYNDPFEVVETTVVRARVFTPRQTSTTANGYFRVIPRSAGHGITWTYFESDTEMEMLPDIGSLQPVRSGTSQEIRLTGIEPRENQFVVRYEGLFDAPSDGEYTFSLFSDDGSKLYVDGGLVVDHDGTHGTTERGGSVTLTAGKHPLVVDYFQQGGGMWIDVFVSGPGIPKQIVPPDLLLLD